MKSLLQKFALAFIAVFLLLINNANYVFAQVDSDNNPDKVTVTGSISLAHFESNLNARFTDMFIDYVIPNRPGNPDHTPNQSNFTITFPNDFGIPSSIPTSSFLFNGVPANSVSIDVGGSETTITAETPQGYNQQTVRISILASAGISNPPNSNVGGYTISTLMPGNNNLPGSVTLEIDEEPTFVSQAAVTPASSIAGLGSRYVIEFSLGELGAMPAGSEIILQFDPATGIPDNTNIGGINLNGTPATNVLGDGNTTLSITTPIALSNNQAVILTISRNVGIINPSPPGTYFAEVSTSAEPTPVTSSGISYSDPESLSFSAILLSDNRVNATSGYEIEFVTGSGSALFGEADKIVFDFPENTLIPPTINNSRVSISVAGGFSDNPSNISIDGNRVKLTTPFDIPGGSEVVVNFSPLAGVQNPSQTINPDPISDNYILTAFTENAAEQIVDAATPSNPYVILDSGSNINSVEVAASGNQGAPGTYDISFSTGDRGRIEEDVSTITVRFGSGTTFPANLNDISASIDSTNVTQFEETGTTGRELTFTLPSGVLIGNNASVEMEISGVINPDDGGTKNLAVKTSAEPTFITSNDYSFGAGTFTVTRAEPSDLQVNDENVEFEIRLNNNFNLQANTASVFLRFPSGTVIPETIPTGAINVTSGNANNVEEVIRLTDRTIQVRLSRNGNGDGTFGGLDIAASAGIRNTSIPGEYTMQVWTTNAPNQRSGPSFTLTSRNSDLVTSGSVTSNPNVEEFKNPEFTISFTTGSNGRLRGGTSVGSNTITVQYPAEFDLPASITNTEITVNSQSASSVFVNTSENTITVGMPAGLTIENNQLVTLKILPGAGIANPSIAPESESEVFPIGVRTNADNGGFVTENLTITESAPLTITSLSLNNVLGTNDVTSYSIRFRTGTGQVIASPPQGVVQLRFDEKVGLPNSILNEHIRINNINSQGISVSGQTISIIVPQELAALDEHRINISAEAGIIHPYEPGDYTITLVLPEPFNNEVESDPYTITQKNSTISQPNVILDETIASTNTNYTISFLVGSNGRLPAGNSNIILTFPGAVDISNINNPGNETTVNGITTTPTIDGNTLTIPVPPDTEIINNSLITLSIEGITNPASDGSYSISASTTIEPTVITSTNFFIGNSNISFVESSLVIVREFGTESPECPQGDCLYESLDDNQSYVNVQPSLRFEFRIEGDPLTTSDFITLRLPPGSQIGANADSELRIINLEGDPLTFTQAPVTSQDRSDKILRFSVGTELPASLAPGDNYVLRFNPLSGIFNPAEPTSNARYEISSTQSPEGTFSRTNAVELQRVPETLSFIDDLKVTLGTYESLGDRVTVEWEFTTGEFGTLESGVGRFFMTFADYMTMPTTIGNSTVSLSTNSTSGTPQNISVAGNVVTLTLPSDANIRGNTRVTINFSKDSNIRVGSTPNFGEPSSTQSGSMMPLGDSIANADFSISSSSELGSSAPSVLPVEMVEYGVTASSSSRFPIIYWETATEYENYGFEIYRRFGDESNSWQSIGFVEGAGNSTSRKQYSLEDTAIEKSGYYYYKIVQMDFDGTTETFGPLEFLFDAPERFSLAQNYPNPFNPITIIPVNIAHETQVSVVVYDVLGRRVSVLMDDVQQPGQYSLSFDASRLASGVYFVRMVADGQVFTRKMMLVK